MQRETTWVPMSTSGRDRREVGGSRLGDHEGILRNLASTGGRYEPFRSRNGLSLDDKTEALVRLGALVCLGGASRSYAHAIRCAIDAGATADEVVDTLLALSTTIGVARVVAATPQLAAALGFDLDGPLEESHRP